MRARGVLLVPALLLGAASLQAQGSADPQCTDVARVGVVGADACQKSVDVFKYMNVQLGTLVAGGNATLGQGDALGGLGHFALGLRANVIDGSVPDTKNTGPVTSPTPVQSEFTTKKQYLPFPALDAAVGLFKGLPFGPTHILGVDALVSIAYMRAFDQDQLHVAVPDGNFKFGFGGRLGIIQEAGALPGVSVTYFRRDLPTVSVNGVSGTDSIGIQDFKVKTTAWRVVASKSLGLLGLAAGVGQDKYDAAAKLDYTVNGFKPIGGPFSYSVAPTRTNIFADLTINLAVLRIVGEVGQVSGGTVSTYNSFDKKADDTRLYGSVGIRIGH
jgi:hypothetical protein